MVSALKAELRKSGRLLLLLLIVVLAIAIATDRFVTATNVENLVRRTALFGVLSLGVLFVMIIGGIDLSIGSVVSLIGCLLPFLLIKHDAPVAPTLAFLLALGAAIGYCQGLIITSLRVQPFLVTLCGLLICRGAARIITGDEAQGFAGRFGGLRLVATGSFDFDMLGFRIPFPVIILFVLAGLAFLALYFSVYGRYCIAMGHNEEAVRFSGIATKRIKVSAYVVSALLAAIGGILFSADINSSQASELGNLFELYSIAAAVLGGCSTRGGEGSVLGVIIGTALIQVLRNAIVLMGIPSQWEYALVGGILLMGVSIDGIMSVWSPKRTSKKRNVAESGDGQSRT